MPISRSQMERQLRMGGGIMKVAPRQGYFLGGVGDALKGAVKGVAKGISGIFKSDLGKAALLGVGAFGLPGTSFKGFLGGGGFKLPEFLSGLSGEKTLGKTLKVGAAGSLLGAVLGGLDEQEEEDIVEGRNVAALETKLRTAYADLGTFKNNPEGLEAQIKSDLSEYTQDMSRGLMSIGGRASFKDGTEEKFLSYEEAAKRNPAMFVDTTTSAYGDAGKGRPVPEFLKEQKSFKENLKFLNKIKGGISPDTKMFMLKKYMNEALESGEISKGQYEKMLMPLFGEMGEKVTKQMEAYDRGEKADGGRMKYARGTDQIVDQASGIMGLPQRVNQAGVKELDLRESGGFIPPVGIKEKADDIPAMLSNNEFVFTADAVRGMGGGDVNKGAQRLYDQMKMLEKGGRV